MIDGRLHNLSQQEQQMLLAIARQAVRAAAAGQPLPVIDLDSMPPALREARACFVTLRETRSQALRGCTGVLTAQQPLAEEVVRTACQTALNDPRFLPVRPEEVEHLDIEISILTEPQQLDIARPDDLPSLLRVGIDGVTIYRGPFRATFLPQVWEKMPDPVDFLDQLCLKAGLPARSWQKPGLRVETYQVEEFSEGH